MSLIFYRDPNESVLDTFGIVKPTPYDLKVIIGFRIVVFISMEIVKAILRKKIAREIERRKVLI